MRKAYVKWVITCPDTKDQAWVVVPEGSTAVNALMHFHGVDESAALRIAARGHRAKPVEVGTPLTSLTPIPSPSLHCPHGVKASKS